MYINMELFKHMYQKIDHITSESVDKTILYNTDNRMVKLLYEYDRIESYTTRVFTAC